MVVAEYAGPGTFALTLPVPRSRTRGAVHLKMTDARVRLPPLWGSLCWELARAPLWGSLCWELARAPRWAPAKAMHSAPARETQRSQSAVPQTTPKSRTRVPIQ